MARVRCHQCGKKYGDSLIECPNCAAGKNRRRAPSRHLRSGAFFLLAFVLGGLLAVGVTKGSDLLDARASQRLKGARNLPRYASLRQYRCADLLYEAASELRHLDLAEMHLLCAEGLPGSEDLDVDECLGILDSWVKMIREKTEKALPRFHKTPEEWENSEEWFRILVIIRVLRKELGTGYDKDLIIPADVKVLRATDDKFFKDSRHVFLHGVLTGDKQGTCSSLPVLTAAVGRRLGYPLKLVTAKSHVFVRWESPNGDVRFNIESGGEGVVKHPDSYYMTWPFPISTEELAVGHYLKSLIFEQELAMFLAARGRCLMKHGRYGEARAAYQRATVLDEECRGYTAGLIEATKALMLAQDLFPVKGMMR